jgi:amino acid adenylation domain-containing protein
MEVPKDAAIHKLFEAQVERTPDAIALEFAGKRITYRDLNRRANQIAHHLRGQGVESETFVGILVDRCIDLVAGLLGILKAGGAYVPLDPAYPKERLKFMMSDSNAALLVAQEKFSGAIDQVKSLNIDALPRGNDTDDNLPALAKADAAACVIYTSGSTGTPKGVVGLHRAAINRCAWMWNKYPFGSNDTSCQKTSVSFVDSVWEIFGALLQGVRTTIIPDSVAKEPRRLLKHLARHQVTRIVLVPSLLTEILDCPDVGKRLSALRYCISSGEALSAELASRFRKALPNCRLINLYGSCEVSADVTYYEVKEDDGRAKIPIGRPISNTQIYLLDANCQPVPVGVAGEIHVGGANLARGYWNRAELTAERFIADPFGKDSSRRLFKTGDRACYRADGNLEFLGRADQRVKIRGCRVEPGEVEAALRRHPAVRDCVVVASSSPHDGSGKRKSKIKDQKFDNSLIAYVVPAADKAPAGSLREFLKQSLPDFMVPSVFVLLAEFPLLPNGKVNRQELASTERHGLELTECAEPRTDVEALIAQIWQELLGIERIGVEQNFFELGGHSLLAAQVVARLRAVMGVPLTIRDLFGAPTVARLAALSQRNILPGRHTELPPIKPTPRVRFMPVTLSQERLFLFSQLFGGGDFLNMPYAYRLTGPIDVVALEKAIQEIVRRHELLRSAFVEHDGRPVNRVRPHVKIKLPLIDLSRMASARQEEKLERLSRQDAGRTFDVEKAPLLRLKLVRLEQERHILLVTMHHMITDQGSMGVFRNELGELYNAFSRKLSSPLLDPPIQYRDFAAWQAALLLDGRFRPQITFWQKQLGGRLPALEFRKNGKKAVRFHSSRQPIAIDGELFLRLKDFARAEGCTPFMIFVTALTIQLYRHTGQKDVRIGTLVANRGQAGTEGLIGYFVNAIVLRIQVSPEKSRRFLLRTVREVCLAAYARQDLPFEYLESLIEKKRRGHPPIYQVMLNYRGMPTPPREVNGLTIASWNGRHRAADPGVEISRLDLNFNLREASTKLTGSINFRTDLFTASARIQFVNSYARILEQIVTRPGGRISTITSG